MTICNKERYIFKVLPQLKPLYDTSIELYESIIFSKHKSAMVARLSERQESVSVTRRDWGNHCGIRGRYVDGGCPRRGKR